MDRSSEPSTVLLQVKAWIWVHSFVGAAFLVALAASALTGEQEPPIFGLLMCLLLWIFGFAPLKRKATALAPEDRTPPKGLPGWIIPLMAIGMVLSPFTMLAPLGWVPAIATLLLAGTIAIRWVVSSALAIPVHGETWSEILHLLALGLLFGFLRMIMFIMSTGG